ncbi:ABC transporter ATP-binding protein, partial [Sinorhizobium medicae]
MAGISIQNVYKNYGALNVLKEFSLEISDGEFVVLVGPSGCGKSTMLKILAGLEPASGGKILIGDKDVTDLAPGDRDIAMVFQNYALYPHLTVGQNIGFGLKMRGMPKAEIDKRVHAVARILAVEHLLDRRPKALSGGQRQRIALGRA